MEIYIAQIISITVYKLLTLLAGVLLCYWGYRLFMAGVWGSAGELTGQLENNKLVLKSAAPGTFFVVLGAIVLGAVVVQGMNYNSKGFIKNQVVSNPSLNGTNVERNMQKLGDPIKADAPVVTVREFRVGALKGPENFKPKIQTDESIKY